VSGEEMDLSVIAAKPSRQSAVSAKQANSTFDTTRRTIVSRYQYVIILRLYKSLVRKRLEY